MTGSAVNLIAVPFLIGSVPFALSVIIGNRFLKSYRESNKFVFWGGITASAFAGWTVSNMIMARYTESELFGAERECNVCDSDSQSFCGKCRNHKGSCCRCVGSSDWEEMQREFPEVPYDAESFDQYGRKIRKLVGNCPVCHGFFDVKPPNPEACNCDEDYDAESFSADSKFKPPYMKGDRLDTTRGNDGKFRRRLVVPLEKNA